MLTVPAGVQNLLGQREISEWNLLAGTKMLLVFSWRESRDGVDGLILESMIFLRKGICSVQRFIE